MSIFQSSVPLPPIPDDLTIPQFILNTGSSTLHTRPPRPDNVPWLIEDETGRKIGHAEIVSRTYGLANAMSMKWRITRNDAVCIFSPNNVDYPIAIWAIHQLGAIVTPANPAYKPEELAYQLQATKAKLLVVHPAFTKTAHAAAKEAGLSLDRIIYVETPSPQFQSPGHPSISDLVQIGLSSPSSFTEIKLQPGEAKKTLAFLSFSSGTTGRPKAVQISHYGVIANVLQKVAHFGVNDPTRKEKCMDPGDVAMAVLPFFHIYGLVVILHYMLYSGLSLVVVPQFNFPKFLKSIDRHRVTHLFVVPPQIVLLCKQQIVKEYDFSHVKFCSSGAAPLSGELLHGLRTVFPNAVLGQGYGLTETCTTVTMVPPDVKMATVGSAGVFIPGIQAKVVKPDGTLAGEGEQGELIVKGPSIALGYHNNAEATRETFLDGWVRTGDEVIVRNGDVFIVDRLKEIMKVRGFQVAPAELEGHLLLHPDVTDACVVPLQDDYSGELPLAYVVLSEKAAQRVKNNAAAARAVKDSIKKHVADVKVNYKHLAGGVEFIDAIPKNPSGKILRRVLRDQAKSLKRGKEVEVRARL